jgi:pSer/pThr/pTyr-binding forkhead associated (FHA) protein
MIRNLIFLDRKGLRQVGLDAAHFHIGREEGNDLVLDDPEVSRRHARIELRGQAAWVVDLGSRNGIRRNGVRIVGATMLAHRDILTIGTFKLRFTQNAEAWRNSQLGLLPGEALRSSA